jgi:flagellar basal body-associated protein FliL
MRNRRGGRDVVSQTPTDNTEGGSSVSLLYIILIIVLVLLLLGFFSRGRW